MEEACQKHKGFREDPIKKIECVYYYQHNGTCMNPELREILSNTKVGDFPVCPSKGLKP